MAYIDHLDCFESDLDSPSSTNNSSKVKVLVTNPINARQAKKVADEHLTSRFNEEINAINAMIDTASKNGRFKVMTALLDTSMASKVIEHYTALHFKASTYNYAREVSIDWSEVPKEPAYHDNRYNRDICT